MHYRHFQLLWGGANWFGGIWKSLGPNLPSHVSPLHGFRHEHWHALSSSTPSFEQATEQSVLMESKIEKGMVRVSQPDIALFSSYSINIRFLLISGLEQTENPIQAKPSQAKPNQANLTHYLSMSLQPNSLRICIRTLHHQACHHSCTQAYKLREKSTRRSNMK